MTQKKKAELQRKLAMAPVARPPADLLARLKNDIPHDLHSVERDRQRLSRSIAFNLRVAASIIIMIVATVAMVHFLSRGDAAKRPAAVPAMSAPQRAETAEITVALEEPAPAVEKKELDRQAPARTNEPKDRVASTSKIGGVVGGISAVTTVPPPAAPAEAVADLGVAAPVSEPVPAPVPASAPAPPPAAPVALMSEARATELRFDAPQTIFGISVDAGEFARLKDLIDRGEAPEAQEVNIEALVNHFAGAGATRRDVRLEVEGSRSPLEPGSAILRYTIDTAQSVGAGSRPPVATNARLEIELNAKAIADYRLAGGASVTATEPKLLKNLSATGLIELQLRPGVRPRERVATVKLRYRSVADGRERQLLKTIDAHDLARNWTDASRRHRLATLGAVWGESLKGTVTADDVARRAEELAHEAPSDARARDLAKAATASSRLRTSSPTGSGH